MEFSCKLFVCHALVSGYTLMWVPDLIPLKISMTGLVALVIYVSAHDLTIQVMSRLWLCQCYCRKVSSAYAKTCPRTSEGWSPSGNKPVCLQCLPERGASDFNQKSGDFACSIFVFYNISCTSLIWKYLVIDFHEHANFVKCQRYLKP